MYYRFKNHSLISLPKKFQVRSKVLNTYNSIRETQIFYSPVILWIVCDSKHCV